MSSSSRRGILRDAWRVARPYWFSEERWMARGLLAALIAMMLAQVWVNVRLNSWRNDFYNTLQNYDESGFFYQLGIFIVIAMGSILLSVYQVYLQQLLQIRWRRWMTNVYLHEWLADQTYYRLQLTSDPTDNPDQRIAEDLNLFPLQTLNLSLGLVGNAVNAISFSFVLWTLSGALTVSLGALGPVEIPGYMFWAVMVYTVFGTWMTIHVGRPLIGLNFAQQRFEADLRFSLVRLRENSESVAFYRGEEREFSVFWQRFGRVFGNYIAIMVRTRLLGFYTQSYLQVAVLFPYLMMAPRYFSERLALGVIQQTADAFGQLQGSLAFIVTNFTSDPSSGIATWLAIVRRLSTFRDRVDEIHAAKHAEQPIAVAREGEGLAVRDLELDLPDGSVLRRDIALDVPAGGSLLVTGRTGTGKSMMLRAIAGIWPFGRGRVRLDARRAFFIPQKAYIPLGTLRQALLYPDEGAGIGTERLVAILEQVGLGHFAGELDKEDIWSQRLSGGEQQRLSFARVLLAEPAIVFLDEATSALDEPSEQLLYRLLREAPWHPTVVSVGHRSTIRAFHDVIFDLAATPSPQGTD
jgi:vitamin B12/bleomycin/antimicrobial peptide transport system ATP-binding/permease protein